MRILLALVLCTFCACQADHNSPHEDEWIDPLDLFAHDPTMIERDYSKYREQKQQNSREGAHDDSQAKYEHDEYRRSHNTGEDDCLSGPMPCVNHISPVWQVCVSDCTKERETLRQLEDNIKSLEKKLSKKPADHGAFFQQYVAGFVRHLERAQQVSHMESSHFVLQVDISESDMESLRTFARGSGERGVQNAHAVLGGMLRHVRQVDIPEGAVVDWGSWLTTVCWVLTAVMSSAVAVNLTLRFGIPWGRMKWWVFWLIFLISVPWTWWRLYKEEIVRRMASMDKERPPECHPESMSMWQRLRAAVSIEDECEKFYTSLHIDPWMDVPPTKALVVTFSKLFLDPMQYLGEASSKMVMACLKEVPAHLAPVALAVLILIFVMLLIMFFGYRINLCYLLDLSPSRQVVPAIDARTSEQLLVMADQVKQLTEGNSRLQVMITEQRRALDEQLGQPQPLALPSIRPGELLHLGAPPSYPGHGGYPPEVAAPPTVRPRNQWRAYPPQQPHSGAGDQPRRVHGGMSADVLDGEPVEEMEVEQPQPVEKTSNVDPVVREAQSTSPEEEQEEEDLKNTEVKQRETTASNMKAAAGKKDVDIEKSREVEREESTMEPKVVSSMTPDESTCSPPVPEPPVETSSQSAELEAEPASGPMDKPDTLVTSTTDGCDEPASQSQPASLHSSFDFLVHSSPRTFADSGGFDAQHFEEVGSTSSVSPPKPFKPAESSDDSDLEIIEEEPEQVSSL